MMKLYLSAALALLFAALPASTYAQGEQGRVSGIVDQDNFANPVGTLPNALPTGNAGTAPASNTVQPGQPYSSSAAGTFGRLTSTVGTTVGLGTNRQVQLALRVNF